MPAATRPRHAARVRGRPRRRASNAAGSPERNALATAVDRVARNFAAARHGRRRRPARRLRARSCRPGGSASRSARAASSAAATASAASRATDSGCVVSRIQPDTLRASASMSEVSGASNARWYVAWSPTMFTIGVRARRALCRFAMPFPRPGPRCSSVAAGLVGHAAVAVGGAGRDTFEQREHRAHLGDVVERGDELHLRRSRVGEAHVDAVRRRAFGSVRARRSWAPSITRVSVEHGAGIQDAVRVERGLDAAHERELGRILELEEVLLLLLADAVLGRDRAAELRCRPRGSRA